MSAEQLTTLIKKARYVFVCGNGGSASTAEHFATDLIKKRIPAICLNSNVSAITMIANDYGYEHIFSMQLALYAKSEDLLITISCSGDSPNIVEVRKEAYIRQKMNLYGFETFSEDRDYGKLENEHLRFAHEVASKL